MSARTMFNRLLCIPLLVLIAATPAFAQGRGGQPAQPQQPANEAAGAPPAREEFEIGRAHV